MILRTILVWVIGLPITALFFLLVLLSAAVDRSGRWIHSIGAIWSSIITLLAGVKIDITGKENIPSSGPVILASNHQGIFDIPVLQSSLPVDFRWVAKSSLFKIPVIGWTMSLAGYISIERESASKAFRSIEAAAEKIHSGRSVLLFPEGTRSKEDALLPFKRGLFMLATKSEVPLVPISITGTREIMKSVSPWIRPRTVRVSIGKPINTKGLGKGGEAKLMKETEEEIKKNLKW